MKAKARSSAKPLTTEEKIFYTLQTERFARWYKDEFVPNHIEESNLLLKRETLQRIRDLFSL